MRGTADPTVVGFGLVVRKDRNYGLLKGWLVSYVGETMPGYWELVRAEWMPDELEALAMIRW